MFAAAGRARAGLAAGCASRAGVQEGLLAVTGTGLLEEERELGELGLSLGERGEQQRSKKNEGRLGWMDGNK